MHASQGIANNGTCHVHFPNSTQRNFQVFFKVKKFKVVYNVTKKPFYRNAHSTHGLVVLLHARGHSCTSVGDLLVDTQGISGSP